MAVELLPSAVEQRVPNRTLLASSQSTTIDEAPREQLVLKLNTEGDIA